MGNKQPKQASTELTDQQLALLEANTLYTEKEIRNWHKSFMHDCPNGQLDKKKFVEMYKDFCPNGTAAHLCKYAFHTFDTDHDGLVHFEDFLLTISGTTESDYDDRFAVVFDSFDTSTDGHIDRKELANLISAMYDLLGETDRKGDHDPKKRAAEIIEKLDLSHNKKLSKPEFIIGCKTDPVIRQLLASKVKK